MLDDIGIQKKRFRQMLGALPCGYLYGEVLVDGNSLPIDYKILDVNHTFSEYTATSKEKIIGKRISGLFSIASTKDDIQVFTSVGITGDPVEKEFYSPRFDIYFKVFCYAPREGYFVAFLTNISREKKFERNLNFIRTFGNSTSDEFFIIDHNGVFIAGNLSVAAKLGVNENEIPGHHFSELNTMVEGEWWKTLWESLLLRGSLQFETEHKGLEEGVYPVEVTVDLMEFRGKNFAVIVAKNVSSRSIMSKALKQDRRFIEQAASMAGYFVWMIDSSGVFRPLLSGSYDLISGPANEVFFPLFHSDDRDQLLKDTRYQVDGSKDLRMRTDKGLVYHKFIWSRIENDCMVGVCYPISGAGLAGLGSSSVVMDAIGRLSSAMLENLYSLEELLEQKNYEATTRMIKLHSADVANVLGRNNYPRTLRFDSFLKSNTGMLKNLIQPEISLVIETSTKAAALCDPDSFENILVRLLIVLQNTNLATGFTISSIDDLKSGGVCVSVKGYIGIQDALEGLFIPRISNSPGLASVYAMVRSHGGKVVYETVDNSIKLFLTFPSVNMDADSATIVIALADSVDAARSRAALINSGFSVAVETNYSEIIRRITKEGGGLLIVSASIPDFSPEEIIEKVPGISLIQIGGERNNSEITYLSDGFRTSDLVNAVRRILDPTAETLQVEDSLTENLWGERRPKPQLS